MRVAGKLVLQDLKNTIHPTRNKKLTFLQHNVMLLVIACGPFKKTFTACPTMLFSWRTWCEISSSSPSSQRRLTADFLCVGIGKVAVGGSHGGKGGRTDDTDQNAGLNTPATSAPVYGSIEEPQAFGSGGSPNLGVSSASGGVGGGLIKIKASVVTVEGKISADGTGASRGGGGSGGTYCTKSVSSFAVG